MKNKKGEITTILTLGMILVGAVLTIATSFFANKTKNLASNPRALTQSTPSTSSASATLTLTPTSTGRRGRYLGSGNAYLCEPNNPPVSFTFSNKVYTFDGNGCDVEVKRCPNDALPFACVVVDDLCKGEPRYRWYGCTGQPCQNTKIKQAGRGPGVLVGIPDGMAKYDDSKCQSQLATPTPPPINPPSTNSCEKDGKGICIEKMYGDKKQDCADYDSRSQVLNRSCGDNNMVCCSIPTSGDGTSPGITSKGGEGQPCIVEHQRERCNDSLVPKWSNKECICVTPTPLPSLEHGPPPPNGCISGTCDSGAIYSYKCLNPIGNKCGGEFGFYHNSNCSGSPVTTYFSFNDLESYKNDFCFNYRSINYRLTFIFDNINYDYRKPYSNELKIYLEDTGKVLYKEEGIDLSKINRLEVNLQENNINGIVSWTFTYDPAGNELFDRSISGVVTSDGTIYVTP